MSQNSNGSNQSDEASPPSSIPTPITIPVEEEVQTRIKRGSSLYKLKGAAKNLILEKKRKQTMELVKKLKDSEGKTEEDGASTSEIASPSSRVKGKGSILAAFSVNAFSDNVREKTGVLASLASGLGLQRRIMLLLHLMQL